MICQCLCLFPLSGVAWFIMEVDLVESGGDSDVEEVAPPPDSAGGGGGAAAADAEKKKKKAAWGDLFKRKPPAAKGTKRPLEIEPQTVS